MTHFRVFVAPSAWRELKGLPGVVRQRARRAVDSLATNPRPDNARALEMPGLECEVWRLRIDKWRILYAISDADRTVDVLAVRKRPPYDYSDLERLLATLT